MFLPWGETHQRTITNDSHHTQRLHAVTFRLERRIAVFVAEHYIRMDMRVEMLQAYIVFLQLVIER